MAQLDVQGFDAFAADLEAAKNLTEDESYQILEAGGEVVKNAMQQKIVRLGLVRDGILRDSIKMFRRNDDQPYLLIYPEGEHHITHGYGPNGRGTGKRRTVNASEVGFVLEYGAAGRAVYAYHWMENAVEGSTEETTEAMQEAFNEVLDEKGVGQ